MYEGKPDLVTLYGGICTVPGENRTDDCYDDEVNEVEPGPNFWL